MEEVILVNKHNNKIGTCEKLKAHKEARLHRAFSIFIFNSKGELLLQQRAKEKYHCPALWTNTVCSHPRPNESYKKAIHRRMIEEMGFDCKLKKSFNIIYKVKFDNGLTEYEYDRVFIGKYDKEPTPNPEEVMNYKWVKIEYLKVDVEKNPNKYTPWMKIILKRIKEFKF